MIENIRNYSGLTIVVLVTVFLGFLFIDIGHLKSAGGGDTVLRIDGRGYSGPEYQKLGHSSRELAMGLRMFDVLTTLGGFGGRTADSDGSEEFFVNRMIVRNAAEEFGITVDEEEINKYIKEIQAFAGPDGKYDAATYRDIIEKGIGRMGLNERDVRDLASDAIIARELSNILGTGLSANRQVVTESSALSRQQISTQVGRIDIASFKEAIKPTDEEVKSYWETIQDSFKTEPKRKFTYFVAAPKLPEPKPEAKPEEGAAPVKPDPTKADPALQEEKRNKQRELDDKIDDLMSELEKKKGAGFEDLAKENGFEAKSTELFPLSTPPAELAVTLRSTGRSGSRAVDFLFAIKETSDPYSKISDALAVGENQWLVARLDGEEAARTKTFEEAREQAKAQYIEEKAREAMRKSGEEQIKKIRDAITGGKSFADAAKEAGLEVKPVGPVTASFRPTDATTPSSLFSEVRFVDPGTVADLVNEPLQAFIVFVEKREVVKSPDIAARLDSEVTRANEQNRMIALIAWLEERVEAAKVERLYKR